jgi:hypothetical protein
MNVAFNDSTGIVTFDVQILNKSHRNIFPPIHFVVTNIRPDDIALVDFDGASKDGFPFYDFSAKLGDDNILTPDEWSGRVTMKFHTVTARSFAIGFRIDLGPPVVAGGTIGGAVFRDDNQDGQRERCDRCEPGIPGITVVLVSNAGGDNTAANNDGDGTTRVARTDSNGVYKFPGLREGVYSVRVIAPLEQWKITSTNPLLVTLVKGGDGKVQDFMGADFGLFPLVPFENLFGPIVIGPMSRFGTELDSTFVNPPSMLPIVYAYFLEVKVPPMTIGPWPGVVDSAEAWINDEMVFTYRRPASPDSSFIPYRFERQIIQLPDSLVKYGDNTIHLLTMGDEHAALMWWVYKAPMIR